MSSPIIRPSAAKAAAVSKAARELAGEKQVPVKLRVHPETRWAIRAAASARKVSMRRFLLDLCAQAGVEIHQDDATGDQGDE
jgi:hypothetical protein